MTGHFRSWAIVALAVSTLVVSVTTQAGLIRYDITNATSVQEGYSLSGYIEVSATSSDAHVSSFNLIATKTNNPTLTFSSNTASFFSGGLHATESALYVPVGANLQIYNSNAQAQLIWTNNRNGSTAYFADLYNPPYTRFWNSGSYPVTNGNSWKIGSVPSAVPEPSTWVLAVVGAGAVALKTWRRRRSTLVA